MNFEKPSEPLSPEARNQAIGELNGYIQKVAAMGGNDEEIPLAQQFLGKLQSSELVTKTDWEKMKRRLGDPDDKNSNYH